MESNIPEDRIKSIEDDVQKLILSLTSYEQNDDNFKRCVDFTMYNILCEKHSIPSETNTRELLHKFIVRYECESFSRFSKLFENSLRDYVETYSDENISDKTKWYVLECLLQLSKDAFKTEELKKLEGRLNACDDINITLSDDSPEEETEIDWQVYLQEGSEKYRLPSDDSNEDSSYDSDEPFDTVIAKSTHKDCNALPPYNDLFDHFPQEPANVLDRNAHLKKILEDEFRAKEWLSSNVQNSWWKGEPYEIDVSRRHPAAVFGLRWEEKFRSSDLQFLEEYKILRELLWIFVLDDEIVRNQRIEYLQKKASVSSLIQSTVRSIVDEILDSATKYFQLRAYYEQVFSSENVLTIPFSYQAYASVVKDLCATVLQKVVDEENIVKQQETTYTLLTLYNNLRSLLNDINFFYEIHTDCFVSHFSEKEAWLCIIRFLSKVFYKLQVVESTHRRKILLSIFFRTFKVYADMIDGWLTENKLYDWRNEFFIKKDEGDNVYKTFFLDNEANRDDVAIAPFFTRITENLINCGQNVEFLYKLNKIQDVTSEILEHGTLIECIVREFSQRLYEHRRTSVDVSNTNFECKVMEEVNAFFQDGETQEEFVSNPYLIQAYSDVLRAEDLTKMTLRDSSNPNDGKENVNLDLFPVAHALEQTICSLIEKKEAVIAKFFQLAIVENYKFFDHIRTLTGLLLIDTRSFCGQMNSRMDKKTWGSNHAIQILLHDCVQSSKLPFGDLLHFVFDKNAVFPERHTSVCVSEVVKMVDCITLQYSTQWPMSKIFTTDVVESVYDPLFKLVLKINIAVFSVTRLRFKDLPDDKLWRCKLRKLQVFRYWVALLLQKLRSYMMFIVPQCLGDKLIESIGEINNFTCLQGNYLAYLENAKSKCLIDPKMLEYLNRALERVWHVCDDVRDLWTKATLHLFREQDVTRSVELYVQCAWYLSQILKKFVKEKRTDNPLFNLWSEVQHLVKMYERSIPEDLSFKSNQPTLV